MGEFVKNEQYARKLLGFEEEGTLTPTQEALVSKISFIDGKSVIKDYDPMGAKEGTNLFVCIDGKPTKLAYGPYLVIDYMLPAISKNSPKYDLHREVKEHWGNPKLDLYYFSKVLGSINKLNEKHPNWVQELSADAQTVEVLMEFDQSQAMRTYRAEKEEARQKEEEAFRLLEERYENYDHKRGLCGFPQDGILSESQKEMLSRISLEPSDLGVYPMYYHSDNYLQIYLNNKPTQLFYELEVPDAFVQNSGLDLQLFVDPESYFRKSHPDDIQKKVASELYQTKNKTFVLDCVSWANFIYTLSLVDVADNMERINKEHPGWLGHPKFDRATIDTLFEFLGRPKLKIQEFNQAQSIDPNRPVKSITLPEKGNKKKGRGL